MTGIPMGTTPEDREASLIHMSERVYQFQRVFNVRLGQWQKS